MGNVEEFFADWISRSGFVCWFQCWWQAQIGEGAEGESEKRRETEDGEQVEW